MVFTTGTNCSVVCAKKIKYLYSQQMFNIFCIFCLYFSLQSERAELISQIKSLRGDSRQYQSIVDEKMKEIEPLHQALGKLRNANNAGRGGLCSSEEELNDVVCYEFVFLI